MPDVAAASSARRPSVPPGAGGVSSRAATVLCVVVASHAVIFLDKALLGLTAQPLMRDLDLSKAQFGALAGASYLLFGVACLLGGLAADRFSPRWILLGCGLMWALGQLPAVFAVSGGMLYASRVIVGAAEGPAQPLSHVAAYAWFPNERRGLPAALITCGTSVGKLALVPVLTLVIVQFGWRAAFVTVGALSLAWSAAWLALGRTGPYGEVARQPRRGAAGRRESWGVWRRLLVNGTFLGTLAAFFAQGALVAVVFTWLPSYFRDVLGFSAPAAGVLFTLPSALAIVFLLSVGPLTDRMLRRGVSSRMARGVFGGGCLTCAGLTLATLHWVRTPLLAVVIVMVGYGLSTTVQAVAHPAVAEIAPPERRAGALAALAAVGSAAGVLSPALTGRVLDAAGSPGQGYADAFLLVGLVVAAGGLCLAIFVDPGRDAALPVRERAARPWAGRPFDLPEGPVR
ncbi:MFS transporter [Streptomyces tsukubensis]|nr:MFS transporter [Streptomyces tsukubensis]